MRSSLRHELSPSDPLAFLLPYPRSAPDLTRLAAIGVISDELWRLAARRDHSASAPESPIRSATWRGASRPVTTAASPWSTGMRTRSDAARSAPAIAARAPSVHVSWGAAP